MALAIADLDEYRRRRETPRETNLRLELVALADSIRDFDERTKPYRQRQYLVAAECGPVAMQAWMAIESGIARLRAQSEPDEGSAA